MVLDSSLSAVHADTARSMPPRLAMAYGIVSEAAALASAAFRGRGCLVRRAKQPQDFVSEADEAVERGIRQRLAEAFAGESVIGEEQGGTADGGEPGSCWLIDPIDGTHNFLRGVPLWGVSLGWVEAGVPVLGVIALPALGITVAAEKGKGLFVNGNPAVRDTSGEAIRMVSVGDSDWRYDDAAAITRCVKTAGWVVEAYRCSSAGLAFSALGMLDGHLQKHISPWDIAAGLALCSEAGLVVRYGPLGEDPTWGYAATQALSELADGLVGVSSENMGRCTDGRAGKQNGGRT